MAKTKIQWCEYTFNPWRGCAHVSAGCDNCYAEQMAKRNPKVFGTWGPNGVRVVASDGYWKQPLRWNRLAAAAGLTGDDRPRVFCGSLMDWAEARHELIEPRRRLFAMIDATPNLQWMLLTKRPENILRLIGELRPLLRWKNQEHDLDPIVLPNVWLGVTIENTAVASRRLRHLLRVPAQRRFVSLEPLLGPIRIVERMQDATLSCDPSFHGTRIGKRIAESVRLSAHPIHEVIIGGESGPNARPGSVEWIVDILKQCDVAGIPAYVKQLGSNPRMDDPWYRTPLPIKTIRDPKGGDPAEWPADLAKWAYPAKKTR